MKLRNKILMSAAALAACAATLTSTTLAWYVSNANANAANITGSTASASTAGNLFIAHATSDLSAVDGEYSPAIDFATGGAKITPQLNPIHYDGTDWSDKDGSTTGYTDTNSCLTYSFWLWSTEEADVNVDLTVTNTGSLGSQVVYSGEGTGMTAGTSLSVDAVYALRMAVYFDDTLDKTYDVAAASGYSANAPTDALNAHDYFTAVSGNAPAGATTDTLPISSTMNTWSIGADPTEGTLVTIKIWLEGADIHCFDSCGGQSFKFDFAFSI